ncbi:MAG: hypothetical protein NVSMB64_06600 [Candidatus Velthaea sp.]
MYDHGPELPIPDARPCAVIHESVAGAEIVHAFGVLDTANVVMLESAIARSVRIGKALVVDLRECPSIDDSIVAMLARAYQALGRYLRLIVIGGTTVHGCLVRSPLSSRVQIASAWNA